MIRRFLAWAFGLHFGLESAYRASKKACDQCGAPLDNDGLCKVQPWHLTYRTAHDGRRSIDANVLIRTKQGKKHLKSIAKASFFCDVCQIRFKTQEELDDHF